VDGLSLAIHEQSDAANPFAGSEIQSHLVYGFGRYEVVMQPARGSGLISSFFTYTGPYFGMPHDEIDIEFLGNNTNQVQFNYFKNGKVGASKTIDLPFDAADRAHVYAFEWTPERITWSVDGVLAYRTELNDDGIPLTPAKIILNLWTGKSFMSQWHGPATFESGATADYACVSYQPIESEARSCSTFFLPKTDRARPIGIATNSWASQATRIARAE
jgi:beta-glucanase (GH16 family)